MSKQKQFKWNIVYLMLGVMVFIFAPLEVYLSAAEDMWFSITDFLPYLIIGFVAYVIVWLLYERFVASKIYKVDSVLGVMAFGVGMALYIQGNFVKANYGELNGKAIDWSLYKKEGIVSVSIFVTACIIALLVIIVMLIKRKYESIMKCINTISLCMILLFMYTLVTLFISENSYLKKDRYIAISEGRWDYSKDENYIILLLDGFDSRLMDELVCGEHAEETCDTLQDFTYYEDAKGAYPYTSLAVPQILTGEKYLNNMDYDDYLEEAFAQAPFLHALLDDGYRLKLHTTIKLPQKSMIDEVDNWKYMNVGVASHRRLLGYVYRLVGFRYLPQPLKQYCWFYTDDMDEIKEVAYADDNEEISPEDGYYEWHNLYMHENMDKLNTDLDGKVFHFTHIKGCHDRRDLDSEFHIVKDTDVSFREAAYMNIRLIREYLDALRKLEIYDNSIIVIMADHGDGECGNYPQEQSPLLLIKGKNEKHGFAINDRPVCYDDLQECFINLMEGASAENSWGDMPEGRSRYTYVLDFDTPSKRYHEHPMIEYEVKGRAKDASAMEATGEVYQ